MSSESKDIGQNVAHSRNYKPFSTCVAESADAHVWEIKMWRHGAKTCGGRERGRDGGVEEGRGDGRRKTGIGEQGRQERGVGMEGEGGRGQGGERKCAHPYSCVRGTERTELVCGQKAEAVGSWQAEISAWALSREGCALKDFRQRGDMTR